jgi:hypothetical protein
MDHLYIGIDPGAKGAIAVQRIVGERIELVTHPMPGSMVSLADLIKSLPKAFHKTAYLEQVSGFIGIPHPGGRMFKFGQGFGWLEMALFLHDFAIVRVRPQDWQKTYTLLSKKGETKPAHKRRICDRVRELYPGAKVTANNCDALMILLWGTR